MITHSGVIVPDDNVQLHDLFATVQTIKESGGTAEYAGEGRNIKWSIKAENLFTLREILYELDVDIGFFGTSLDVDPKSIGYSVVEDPIDLVEFMAEAQWHDNGFGVMTCPFCYQRFDLGHAKSCIITVLGVADVSDPQ